MDAVPFSALVLVIVVLLVVWLFLAHMMSSRKQDARLQFLLSLMEAPPASDGRPDPVVPRPAANGSETGTSKVGSPASGDTASRRDIRDARSVWQELPVVFAAALRGRAM